MRKLFPMDKAEWLERQRDFLASVVARDKKRFVLVYGTVSAIGWVVLTTLNDLLIRHRAIDWGFLSISLAIALACGCACGIMMWRHYEERLRKLSTGPR